MIIARVSGRRSVILALVLVGPVSACVPQGTQATTLTDPAQPRVASYDCGDGASITVENLGQAVRVTDTDGSSLELPAAPASQHSRFGAGGDAIVIDGREALLMRGKHTPLTCTR